MIQNQHKISAVFLYTRNEQFKSKIKRTILSTIASKRIEYLGMNLTKVQNLCSENYKALLKEI